MVKTYNEIKEKLVNINFLSNDFSFTWNKINYNLKIVKNTSKQKPYSYFITNNKFEITSILFSSKTSMYEDLFEKMKELGFKEKNNLEIKVIDNTGLNLKMENELNDDENLLFKMQTLVEKLRATNSSKEKLLILSENNDNDIKQLFEKTYNPSLKYWVRLENIINYEKNKLNKSDFWALEDESLFNTLVILERRQKTWYDAILTILKLINNYPKYRELILNIINKDLKIWLWISTLNKNYWKWFIKETPYMGAVSYNKKKVLKLFEAWNLVYSDLKMDWRYANVKITQDDVYLESRSWNETNFWNQFDFLQWLYSIFNENIVLNGELIIPWIDRYTSNWIISAIVSILNKEKENKDAIKDIKKFIEQNKMTVNEAISKISYVVWDYIPLADYESTATWSKPRNERLTILREKVNLFNHPQLKAIETTLVKNPEEAMKHFQSVVEKGEEGTILKSYNWTWKDWKPTWQIKFKVEDFHDLKIVWFNYWKIWTKNEHLVSSLNVETEDWLLKTSPGWLKEDEMLHITENQEHLLWTIVEVKCSWLSKDRDWNYSLLHPVFVKLRNDKLIAATLEKCIEVNQSNNDLNSKK